MDLLISIRGRREEGGKKSVWTSIKYLTSFQPILWLLPAAVLNSDPNISPRSRNNCGYSHCSSSPPSSTAVTLPGNAAPGGCSALRIKMDDLVWLILSPGGGEPLAPCVAGGDNRRSLMLLLAPPPPLIDWCVEHPSLRPAEERGDTRRRVIVRLHGKHPRPQPRTNRNHHNHHYVTKHIWRLSLLTQMLLHLLCRSCSWCPEPNPISKTCRSPTSTSAQAGHVNTFCSHACFYLLLTFATLLGAQERALI